MSKNIIMNVLDASGYDEMYPFNPALVLNAEVVNTSTASNYNLTIDSFTPTLTNTTGNAMGIISFVCPVDNNANVTITLNNNTAYPILMSNGSAVAQNVLKAGRIVFVKYYNQNYYLIVDKSQVGLDNVNNTSDADKPVSTAQQTALDNKLNIPTLIADSTNLNTLQTPGLYYCSTNASAATMANSPTTVAFALFIQQHSGVTQTIINNNATGIQSWSRSYTSGTWSSWQQQAFVTYGTTTPSDSTGANGNIYIKYEA